MICAIEAILIFLSLLIFFLIELFVDRKISKSDLYKPIDPNK